MVYHHITLVEEYLLQYSIDKKYTCWTWHGEDDPNEVVRDDDDTKDDSDADGSVEHMGIGELLHDLHQGACSNVQVNTAASESNSDYEHNIQREIERTSEQFVKLVRDAREPLYPNCIKFSKLEFLIKLFHIKIMN